MDLREVEEMTLRFSLGDVKAALGEIRERLDDIRAGEVHYRHSGEELHLITHRSQYQEHMKRVICVFQGLR